MQRERTGRPTPPTPEEIRAARAAAGLTQTAAAALIGKPLRTWQGWETAEGIAAHRKMDAALWELWKLKLAEVSKGK
jgi:DNA-binding transcriptional regulator YiaG